MHFKYFCISLNPYFIGLSILIMDFNAGTTLHWTVSILILLDYLFLLSYFYAFQILLYQSQSLFYWIIYSYTCALNTPQAQYPVSILILLDYLFLFQKDEDGNPHITKVSILILLDYLFLSYY